MSDELTPVKPQAQSSTGGSLTITVLGGGAWGSTLAGLATQNGHCVRVWSRRSPESLDSVLDSADLVVSAVAMGGGADR